MMAETPQQGQHSGWGRIPVPLQKRDQWIVMKDKTPIKPRSEWEHPSKELSFTSAYRNAKKLNGEPAYILQPDDPFAVVDFDDVGPPEAVGAEVRDIVVDLDTYTEVSRSGEGLHLVCEGTRLPERSQKGNLDNHGKVEVFDAGQPIVLTGNQIGPFETISEGGDPFQELQRQYLPEQTSAIESSSDRPSTSLKDLSEGSTASNSRDIQRTLEEYAKTDDVGCHAQRALDRWQSPAGSFFGFQSASEADLAFVSDLAFWCNNDAPLIDDCFRKSNRFRQKWDEIHYSDGRTYGEGTIQTAIRSNYDTFSGHYVTDR